MKNDFPHFLENFLFCTLKYSTVSFRNQLFVLQTAHHGLSWPLDIFCSYWWLTCDYFHLTIISSPVSDYLTYKLTCDYFHLTIVSSPVSDYLTYKLTCDYFHPIIVSSPVSDYLTFPPSLLCLLCLDPKAEENMVQIKSNLQKNHIPVIHQWFIPNHIIS
jgi:hypothetical protein